MLKLITGGRKLSEARKDAELRAPMKDWIELCEFLKTDLATVLAMTGPEILQATAARITERARETGERLPSRVKLPPLRK